MIDEKDLRSCPFCGGDVRIALGGDDSEHYWFITRGLGFFACTCRLFFESEKFKDSAGSGEKIALINKWNTRSNTDNAVRLVKESNLRYSEAVSIISILEK